MSRTNKNGLGGIACPSPRCGHPGSEVIDSRPADDHHRLRRRRRCTCCHERFTTFEHTVEDDLPGPGDMLDLRPLGRQVRRVVEIVYAASLETAG